MKLSIRLKVVIFTSCVVFLVGGSISFYSIFQGRQRIIRDFEMEAVKITSVISEIIANDLYLVDLLSLRRRLRGASVNPGISSTYVTDSDGVVLSDGTGENPLRGQKPSDAFSQKMLRSNSWISSVEGGILKVGGPVLMPDGSRIGYIQVGFSLGSAEKSVREVTRTSFYITLICLAVGVFLAFILATSFTRPILAIVQAAKEIGAGKLDTRLPVKRTDELGVLAVSTNQMAEALQRRQAETERKNRELQALNAIATATSQSLHLDDFFEIALGKVVEVTRRQRVNIRAKDPATGKVKLVAHQGFSQEEVEELIERTPHKMSEQVFASGEPFIINGSSDIPPERLLDQSRSVAWIPIKAGTKVVGVLGISDNQSVPFSPEEVELLLAVGNVIGVAMENTRLFGETKRNLEGIRALHEIDKAITSTLDLHAVLEVLLEKIDLFLPYSVATVRLFNKKSGLLEPVACRNLDEKEWKIGQWKPGRGPANVVFETKAPMMISNCLNDPRVKDPDFFRRHQLVSYLGVPMVAKEEPLGVLSFYTKEEHAYTSEEVEFLTTLAGQAAIAIHNARLYEETERRRREAEELARVAQSLTETLDMTAVGERIVTSVRELFGVKVSMLRLLQPDGSLRALASSGEAFSRSPGGEALSPGTGVTSRAVAEGRPIWSADVLDEPRIRLTDQMRDHQLRSGNSSILAVPLRAHEKIVGSLALSDQAGRSYSDSEVALLQTFADQAALALGNARLYEEVREKVQELQKRTAELERANKVKDEFLSVMSHELRTPLNVVMGYTGMIRDGILGEINAEQGNALEKVISRARDQLTMITSILQAVQLEAGELVVEEQAVGLGDLLNELKLHYDIPSGKEITLIWDYPVDLPVINSDGDKLKHILKNLINNAIKFTSRGSVTISARPVEKRGGADGQGGRGDSPQRPSSSAPMLSFVEFKVTDTGVGIPEEALPVIFERFRQVDSSETRLYGGVGIGLYIVKRFTEMLGGKVEVESEVGKGSTLTVTIPCESQQAERERRGDSLAGSAGI